MTQALSDSPVSFWVSVSDSLLEAHTGITQGDNDELLQMVQRSDQIRLVLLLNRMRKSGQEMIPDRHAALLRWFQRMLVDINSPSDFERACVIANEVRR